jgi:AcrR family transcriptional regulator
MKTKHTLQARRKELGLSYDKIAELSGIPKTTIYDYFTKGDRRLEEVLKVLDMELKQKKDESKKIL